MLRSKTSFQILLESIQHDGNKNCAKKGIEVGCEKFSWQIRFEMITDGKKAPE